jgi:cytochrome c1
MNGAQTKYRLAMITITTAATLLLAACGLSTGGMRLSESGSTSLVTVSGGDPVRGIAAMQRYGCIACHSVPGVPGANSYTGPPLDHWARRGYIAGRLPNGPDNLIRWIRFPQNVDPGVDMPDLGVSDADARDIASYLYTLN